MVDSIEYNCQAPYFFLGCYNSEVLLRMPCRFNLITVALTFLYY